MTERDAIDGVMACQLEVEAGAGVRPRGRNDGMLLACRSCGAPNHASPMIAPGGDEGPGSARSLCHGRGELARQGELS